MVASGVMVIVAFFFVVVAANAIAPPESKPKAPAAAPGAPGPQPAQGLAPATVATRTPEQAAAAANAPADARARDRERAADLQALVDALAAYKDRKGSYPDTGGRVQSACKYEKLDKLCELKSLVKPEQFSDPLGNDSGYWYASDGKTFALYAAFEADNSGGDPCIGDVSVLRDKPNLFCRTSPR
jgi:hypothetical protein